MQKVLYSLLVIGIVTSIAVGSGAMAYFNDVETSTGNTFTAGTLDLTLSGSPIWTANVDNAGPGSHATATGGTTFDIDMVAPGDTATVSISTKNDGSIGAESLTFDIVVTDSEANTLDTDAEAAAEDRVGNEYNISSKITVSSLSWNGSANYATHNVDPDKDALSDLAEVVGSSDNIVTLSELADASPFDITDVDGPLYSTRRLPAGEAATLTIGLKLQNDTGDEYQGDMSTIDLTLEAHQNEV